MAISKNQDIWIGFTDETDEGTFVWSDGTEVDYTNWSGGEPNNWSGDEDCTVVRSNGSWNDLSCTRQAAFVC